MYFPYLRGRQFELIALREYAQQKGDNDNLIPIIEPVRKSTNSLNLAISVFKKTNLRFAAVLNPHVGELSGEFILEQLGDILERSNWIPA